MSQRNLIILVIILLGAGGGYYFWYQQELKNITATAVAGERPDQGFKGPTFVQDGDKVIRTSYHPNGKPKEELTLLNNVPNGPARTWWETGALRSEDNYLDGALHGLVKRYEQDGLLYSEGHFAYGKLDGETKYNLPDGRSSTVTYKNNEHHGPAKYYRKDGSLKEEVEYRQGMYHGPARTFYASGALKQERTFFGGKIDGLQTWYFEDGTLWAKENKKLGKKEGVSEYYFANGQLKQKGSYKDDKLHGTSTWYRPTGVKRSEEEYKDGKLHGWDYDYRWDGTLDDKSHYQDGKYDGLTETYYRSGEVRNRRNYRQGKVQGAYELYLKNGDLIVDITMENDRISQINQLHVNEDLLRAEINNWGKDSAFGTITGALFVAERFDQLEFAGNYIFDDPDRRHEHYHDYVDELSDGFWYVDYKNDPERFFLLLEKWKSAYPDSALPDLVKIEALTSQAWSARGGGYAKTVTQDSFRRFRDLLEEAARLTRRTAMRHPDNPEVYVHAIQIAMGLSRGDKAVRELFEKGQQADPYYPDLYRQMATTLLPRWGGARGELETFMRESTANLEAPRKNIVRAHILLSAMNYVGLNDYLKNFRFSKRETLQYLGEYLSKYPHHKTTANTYAWFAHHYRDRERAKEAFDIIGDRPRIKTWDEPETYLQARAWALGETETGGGPDIHRMVSLGNRRALEEYLQNGGDIDARNSNGQTLLHVAALNREWELAATLLEADPQLDIRDEDRYLPIHHAVRHGSIRTVRKLIEKGSPVDSFSLRSAASQGSVSMAKILIEEDPKIINDTSNKKWSAVHSACRQGQTEFLRFLAERDDVDWTAVTNKGNQCLHLVVSKGARDTAEFLLDQNLADLNHRNDDGETPLEKARRHGFNELVEILEAATKE